MRITWSFPVAGLRLADSRGDCVRAASLVAALRALGHDVEVVEDEASRAAAARVRTYRGLVRRLLPGRLALAVRDAGRSLHARAHARRVVAAARRHRAELLVETQVAFVAAGALAARRTGLPLVLDDCTPLQETEALGTGLPQLARAALRRSARQARVVVAVSTAAARQLEADGVPRSKLAVVPNGVDLAAFEAARRDRAAARDELGLGEGDVALVFAGSFQPWHGADALPAALAKLATPPRAVRLVLVGDGPGLPAVLERAAVLGVAHLVVATGPLSRQEVPRALAACDVGVLPASNDYGHPMKLVEYAAAGMPCVAPDLPVVREVIAAGRHGLLVPAGDAPALAAALARLCDDPALRVRLGEAARKDVAAPADWSSRARALLDVAARTSRP